MRWVAVLWIVAACSGTDDAGPDDAASLTIVSPLDGARFERRSLDAFGALVATVPVEVTTTGAIDRVVLRDGSTELGPLVDGAAAPLVATSTTLTAAALAADGSVLAEAHVSVDIADAEVADCHAFLDLVGVAYTIAPATRGIEDPITAQVPINGVPFRSGSGPRTTMLADCSLIRSLALAAPFWRKRGVVEVRDLGVYNYRCINNSGTPPNCTIGLSEHSFGNAIDLASFKDEAGETYVVNDDWVIDPDDATCTAPTEPGKDTWLHEMICELKAAKIWNIVLTPNYNSLHRNHFHVDLTPGANIITRTLLDGDVDTTE